MGKLGSIIAGSPRLRRDPASESRLNSRRANLKRAVGVPASAGIRSQSGRTPSGKVPVRKDFSPCFISWLTYVHNRLDPACVVSIGAEKRKLTSNLTFNPPLPVQRLVR